MADFPTVTELVREHAYLRSLRDRWSVGFERLRRLDLPGGDEPDANLPAMAADEIERLRAERDAWKTAAMGAGTQAVRLREQIIEWAKSHQDDPRTAAEDALLSVAYGDYSPASGEPTP